LCRNIMKLAQNRDCKECCAT